MATRKILTDEDPVLHKVCRPVEKFDERLWQLLDDMADDEDAPDMEDVILGLAADAGLVEVYQVEDLTEAAKKGSRELMRTIRTVLAGEPLPDGTDSAQAQAQPNPTKTAAD